MAPDASPDGTSASGARLLAIDIGNTSIAIGVYAGDLLEATFRVASDRENLPDEYGMLLSGLLRSRAIEPESVDSAILASTVPPLTSVFREVSRRCFSVEALVVGPGVRTGVKVRYDNPREVGPDRILHAVAALAHYEPPLVVVDLGTALVFDAISREGDYLGGAIAPGIGLASEALFARAAMLSRAVAGVRGRTLIVNLPGSERGARENLEVVLAALAHAVTQLTGDAEPSPPAGTHGRG